MREEMVRERDRLCALQVRISRHHGVDLAGGPLHQGTREREKSGVEPVEQLHDEKAQIERDLIVSAAAGM